MAFAHQFNEIDGLRGRSDGPALNGGSPAPSSSSTTATFGGDEEDSLVAAAANRPGDDRDAATMNPARAREAVLEWIERLSWGELIDVDDQTSDSPLGILTDMSEIAESTSQRSIALVEDDEHEDNDQEDDDQEDNEHGDDDQEGDDLRAEILRAEIEIEILRREINARLEEAIEIVDRLSQQLDLWRSRRQRRRAHGR